MAASEPAGRLASTLDDRERLRAEIARLSRLLVEMRSREQAANDRQRLLRDLFDAFPSSMTVQNEDGRYLMVNAAAAERIGVPSDRLLGAMPEAFLSEAEVAEHRRRDQEVIQAGGLTRREEQTGEGIGARTWMTTCKPLEIGSRTLLLSSACDITVQKEIENELAQRAYLDELTGLPNRLLMQEHVEEMLRRIGEGERFALAFIDLDNFKHINDYYSHAIGDALLVRVAERIADRLRESDVLSRISGDEFLLIFRPVDDDETVRGIVNQLLDDLKQPFHVEAFEIFTSASIGVSFFPDHGDNYEALRRNADNAMYRAKNNSKGGAIYFDIKMGSSITARMEQEQRLRLAIRDCRFCCAYQPKVDMHTGEVVGFETLIRWRDDDGEIHPPSTFIGLAVELGLIDPITRFVLDDTVKSFPRLDDAFGASTTVSVNIAAKQASDLSFMRSFTEVLRASNCAHRIMLELTEEAFVAGSQFQLQILPLLRELGVRVSIDDFGTGYSSLSVLSEITADELKVDRTFITHIHRRPRSQSILKTIESLGHSLGMTIIAEGIETEEERAYLRANTRIRYAQGFYFSKPFFLDDLVSSTGIMTDGRDLEQAREAKSPRLLPANRRSRAE